MSGSKNASEAELPSGRHEIPSRSASASAPASETRSAAAAPGGGNPPGTGGVPAHHGRRRRSPLPLLLLGAAMLLGTTLTPVAIGAVSVSVADHDREIELAADSGVAHIPVPADWPLERRPFADAATIHTPDGALALCVAPAEPAADAAALLERLAARDGWSTAHASTEHAPSGAEVVHLLREGDAQAESCDGHPVEMLIAVAPAGDGDAPFIEVRVGADGELAPYLGELADLVEGMRAS